MRGIEPKKPEDKPIFGEGAFPTLGAPAKRVTKPSPSPERQDEAPEAASENTQGTSAAPATFAQRSRQLQQEETTAAAATAMAQQSAQKLAEQKAAEQAKRQEDADKAARAAWDASEQRKRDEEAERQKRRQELEQARLQAK